MCYNPIIMKNLSVENLNLNIEKHLIANRISIVLFSYGLNEFYNAFKYLKSILICLSNTNNLSKTSIKVAMESVAKYYSLNIKSLISSISKLYTMLPRDFFISSPLYRKIKMNCYHKTQFIAEMVFNDMKTFN